MASATTSGGELDALQRQDPPSPDVELLILCCSPLPASPATAHSHAFRSRVLLVVISRPYVGERGWRRESAALRGLASQAVVTRLVISVMFAMALARVPPWCPGGIDLTACLGRGLGVSFVDLVSNKNAQPARLKRIWARTEHGCTFPLARRFCALSSAIAFEVAEPDELGPGVTMWRLLASLGLSIWAECRRPSFW